MNTTPAGEFADYDKAYPHVAKTLERLCAKYGFETVLGIFSSDMPDHRREREEEERQRERAKMRRRAIRALRKGEAA